MEDATEDTPDEMVEKVIGDEMTDCRRYWWMHLLYVSNYFDESKCMVHSWYLAADFQLYCIAAIFFVMCRTPRIKMVVLRILFVLGVVIPTLKTYYLNLDGVLIVTPDLALDLFQNSSTFDKVYKRGHTNLAGYILGMALGYWFYDWQKAGSDPKTFRKYQFLYWTLFPLLFLCCYSGTIFYSYSAAPSLTVHLLYAAFLKPTFALLMCLFIAGVITQLEDLYRPIFEWPVWTIPSRLSFSAYLLHFALIRNFLGMQTTPYRGTAMVLVTRGAMLIISAFICAFFFWILVENPFRNVIREWFITPEVIKKKTKLNTDSTSEVIKENKKLNGFSEKKEDGK
ncbi:hypothetical protein PYW07_005520 [Mythimna separata]|uniref:Acyltransferase 3 domain-containing protein n=1 Tax=Mythimna separata TaxID=271217 RepID=A0AAD7YJM4_MYTSE|nr:hypothetical protein PYW07_005520 [Mythimna separata]